MVVSHPAAIALGSNQGHSPEILRQALDQLAAHPQITLDRVSSWYLTTPVGNVQQPDFLNGCATLHTNLDPEALLQVLQTIENNLGRIRRERWGPRTLDLDLLLYGDRIIATPDLMVPHPRMFERAFVLVPLAEIAPHWQDPKTKRAIADFRDGLHCKELQPVPGCEPH